MDIKGIINDVMSFIEVERNYFDTEHSNLFNISCYQFLRYLEFIAIIQVRLNDAQHESAVITGKIADLSKKLESGAQSIELNELMSESQRINSLLHLEIESFFIFSKIFLDKVAQFIENYFGNQQGISLKSHTKMSKKIRLYEESKGINLPDIFIEDIMWFNEVVTHARDKQIMHQKNPRSIFGTTINSENTANITTIHLYPNDKDNQSQSPNIGDVIDRIANYTSQLMKVIQDNRKHTRFNLKSNE